MDKSGLESLIALSMLKTSMLQFSSLMTFMRLLSLRELARWRLSVLMKLSLQSHMRQFRRWRLSEDRPEAEEVVVAVRGIAAIEVVVEEEALLSQDTVVQNILTFRLETGRGAVCTSNGVRVLFSVVNPPPAHGKMSSRPGHPNETGTSPRILQRRMKTTV